MNQTEDNFLAGIIQLLFIGFIIGFLVLIVKLLSSFEVKHSKPHAPKPLEERLKLLPPSAKVLSDEAKLIFPEQLNQPESFDFEWSHKTGLIKIRVPTQTLTNDNFKFIYFKRYLENNWIVEENDDVYLYRNLLSRHYSCIRKEFDKNAKYQIVKFTLRWLCCIKV